MAKKPLEIKTFTHEATRKNIPTAEFESVMCNQDKDTVQVAYERRNRDLDPQLVWRGKDEQDWSDLIVQAPPLYIQEKVHPKALVDELKRASKKRSDKKSADDALIADLYSDVNGLLDEEASTEFYGHDQHWSNRMISGDSLQVMASLAECEGLRGKVQCIYLDPPYGIKFNSNFQWSTTSTDAKEGSPLHVTREPEQVRAFRDTWNDGIHSYLTYLRDRLTVARDLLTDSGSIFVQIGEENSHRIRGLLDEVFGEENFVSQILFRKTGGLTANFMPTVGDYILWFAKDINKVKSRQIFREKIPGEPGATQYKNLLNEQGTFKAVKESELKNYKISKLVAHDNLTSQGNPQYEFNYQGSSFRGGFKPPQHNLGRLSQAGRVLAMGRTLRYIRKLSDYPVSEINHLWEDVGISGFAETKVYVVQTSPKVIERCILLSTDPGDLVLDPTCGSGTTAYVSEKLGRRWITIDTSRVSVALARSRLMGARYPYYILADSVDGQLKQSEITRLAPKTIPTYNKLSHGFVYERVPHITLKSIVNNGEIDLILDRYGTPIDDCLKDLNVALQGHLTPFKVAIGARKENIIDFNASGNNVLPSGEIAPAHGFMEWEVPLESPADWPEAAQAARTRFWDLRITRQKEIDASIAAKADFEYLYDKPYVDATKVRVAGPFTVESLSPHHTLAVDWDDEVINYKKTSNSIGLEPQIDDGAADFTQMIIENLKIAGVQQSHKEDKLIFEALKFWPGRYVSAEGTYTEDDIQRRAGIFVGPEFGTVSRQDLVEAAKEANEAAFDVLIACAFNYDAHSCEFNKLGRIPILKARMNPDLHMADALKATGAGNLFVVFGEPDIQIKTLPDNMLQVQVFGVDVFKPQTGEVVSENTDGIALWMLDTDYNEETFFVRHAYFLGANDPYKALKTTLKAEIDAEAWSTLNSDISRPFPKPDSGRIAVKVINHLGDEVMKVFAV